MTISPKSLGGLLEGSHCGVSLVISLDHMAGEECNVFYFSIDGQLVYHFWVLL